MADIKRHIGRLINTGTRVIVVFRKVPGDDNHCLVVESDRLPDMYHDNLMTIVNSRESQDVVELYNVLHRRTFSDGRNCLQTIHEDKYIRKVPIDQVEMVPYPNHAVSLQIINNEIDGVSHTENADDNPEVTMEPAPVEEEEQSNDATPEDQANSLIERASLMEQTAAALREEAYMLIPKLRPGPGRPRLTEEEAEAKRQERNAKRRDRYAKEKEAAAKKRASKAKKKAPAKKASTKTEQ